MACEAPDQKTQQQKPPNIEYPFNDPVNQHTHTPTTPHLQSMAEFFVSEFYVT